MCQQSVIFLNGVWMNACKIHALVSQNVSQVCFKSLSTVLQMTETADLIHARGKEVGHFPRAMFVE